MTQNSSGEMFMQNAQNMQSTHAKASWHLIVSTISRVLLLLGLVASLSAWAQSADIAGVAKAPDSDDESSKHVEESEEAFRRRMETAGPYDHTEVIRPSSTGTSSTPEGMVTLPADSRKHLRTELRNIIIEQGEWEPEDVNKIYPYNPSAAAQNDPELRHLEEKAWAELISEYHKREAAALALAGGRVIDRGSMESQDFGQGNSETVYATNNISSSSSRNASNWADRSDQEKISAVAAGSGVSQNALEFLKSQSEQGNDSQGSNLPMGSGKDFASSGQDGFQQQPPSSKTDKPAALPETSDGNSPENMETPPGSLAIAELTALEESAVRQEIKQALEYESPETAIRPYAQSSTKDEALNVESTSSKSGDQTPSLPGTIAIPDLEKLRGLGDATKPEDDHPKYEN